MTPEEMAEIHARAMLLPRPWSAAEIAALCDGPGIVACETAHGFALGRVVLDEAELLTIAVAPAAQGRGEGRACLALFQGRVAAEGAAAVYLEVAETNVPAKALYARAGYREVGRRRGYYARAGGPPVDALVLRRDLAG